MPYAQLAEASTAVLVVVDVQEKMLQAITTRPADDLLHSILRLVGAARILEILVIYTEQYPQGLGQTDSRLRPALVEAEGPLIKTTCSCWRDEVFRNALQRTEREHVILVGLESHVCIQQTALDLLRVDYVPYVPTDAIGSRRAEDMEQAVARMRQAGVIVTTAESLVFELVERCDHPRFKEVLQVVK